MSVCLLLVFPIAATAGDSMRAGVVGSSGREDVKSLGYVGVTEIGPLKALINTCIDQDVVWDSPRTITRIAQSVTIVR